MIRRLTVIWPLLVCTACAGHSTATDNTSSPWLLIDNFEADSSLSAWTLVDAQNDTDPFVPNPQISEVREEAGTGNHFLLRKPAANGIIGNRKAIAFLPLPVSVGVGEIYTFYTRISVEYFPNNHSFGLSNIPAPEIPGKHYDSFEPMIRITDKLESDGSRNDGTLMVLSGDKTYSRILNPLTGEPARPLRSGLWYELWYIVNNAPRELGGQRYDLYLRGGEFETQQAVFLGADFRMRRAAPLLYFMAIANTGPPDNPYGNGGVRYDDIYMAPGQVLSSPLLRQPAGESNH